MFWLNCLVPNPDFEFAQVQVTIRCNKIEDEEGSNWDMFRRRDIFKCIGGTIGMVRSIFTLSYVIIQLLATFK